MSINLPFTINRTPAGAGPKASEGQVEAGQVETAPTEGEEPTMA